MKNHTYMKNIFVTGGAGFIGSAFIHLILELHEDVQVINFDALTYAGNLDNLKDIDSEKYVFVKGDICDKDALLSAIPESCDAIFNFAAESHVDRSITSANEFVQTNVLGTQILLDVARNKNVKRFVQISTDEVMGSLPEDETSFFTEESKLAPNSPYAASKAAAEHFVRAAYETFNLDVIITRCGNNYGERQFPEKLIPLIIANAINDEPLPVYGDGKNVRDWIYVKDHVKGIWMAYLNGKAGESYNFGARNERQNIEVIKQILDLLGKPYSLITYVKDRLGHDRRYAINPSKVETELEWKPSISWEEGLKHTIQWYQNNEEWIKRVRDGSYQKYYKQHYGDLLL
jgi:dTDP-glucose 4,6-dehydratase